MVRPPFPEALSRSPLMEALFELRFTSTTKGAGDVLPGLLFRSLRESFGDVQPLPVAQVPRDVREANAGLRYQPTYRLSGTGGTIQVGDHVFSVVAPDSYPGWKAFSVEIARSLDALRDAGLDIDLERYSLKYTNLLDAPPSSQLALLEASFTLMGAAIPETGTVIRTELQRDDEVTILQIRPGVTVTGPSGQTRSGLMLEIDAIVNRPSGFWERRQELLAATHKRAKELFFQLLTDEAIQRLGPVGDTPDAR
ncbi:MAG: TIGR04255 family protein [Polyangiaceae bacterium]|nr:TIGR04255 family protein [Polyangiaceae bacterium]